MSKKTYSTNQIVFCLATLMFGWFLFLIGLSFIFGQVNESSLKSTLVLSLFFNLIALCIFTVYTFYLKNNFLRENYRLLDIKKNNKLIKRLSEEEIKNILEECVKEEEYEIAQLLTQKLSELFK